MQFFRYASGQTDRDTDTRIAILDSASQGQSNNCCYMYTNAIVCVAVIIA